MQKIRKFQCAVFEKNVKNIFLGILGQKGSIFEFSVRKSKNFTFLPIFFQNRQTDRNEGEFTGSNPPGGHRTNNGKHNERVKWVDIDIAIEDGTVQNAKGKAKFFYQ